MIFKNDKTSAHHVYLAIVNDDRSHRDLSLPVSVVVCMHMSRCESEGPVRLRYRLLSLHVSVHAQRSRVTALRFLFDECIDNRHFRIYKAGFFEQYIRKPSAPDVR